MTIKDLLETLKGLDPSLILYILDPKDGHVQVHVCQKDVEKITATRHRNRYLQEFK